MFNIADYLKKAVSLIDKSLLSQKDISEIVEKHTGIALTPEFYEIRDGILRTKLSPAEKMMLFIKKEPLLMELAPFAVKDIR